jgi:hypothetical protein
VYLVASLGVGILAENGSVHFGFPYTGYSFNPALRGHEIFVGSVPLMVPMSYGFLGYFGFAAGRMVASGPGRTWAARWWQEYLLGVVLAVWGLWIFDPVARLGDRWLLGELFRYRGPGFWFGLPFGSQVGFTGTAVILVGLLVRLTRDDPDLAVDRWTRHPQLVALVVWNLQIAVLAGVAIWLGFDNIGGSALVLWVPAAAVTAVLWSSQRHLAGADRPDPVARAEPVPVEVGA